MSKVISIEITLQTLCKAFGQPPLLIIPGIECAQSRSGAKTKPDRIWGNSLEGIAYDGALDAFDMCPQSAMQGPAMV